MKYVEPKSGFEIKQGDVLFNNTNSPELIGKTAVCRLHEPLAYSNHMTRLRTNGATEAAFLAHQLHFFWAAGYFRHRCTHHVNQASISSGPLADTVPIALPPLPEQRRIVAEIEKQFTRVDSATALLTKSAQALKNFCDEVLHSATTGELSQEWRDLRAEDTNAASDLLHWILEERRRAWLTSKRSIEAYREPATKKTSEFPALPDTWAYATLEMVGVPDKAYMKTGPFGLALAKEDYQGHGIPIIGIENIGENTFVRGSKKFVSAEKARALSPYALRPHDVIISRSGTVGQVCVIPPHIEGVMSTN